MLLVARWGMCALAAVFAVAAAAENFGHVFWADGFRGRSPEGRREMHVLTSHYGAAFDVERASLLHLGPLGAPLAYAEAASVPENPVRALPTASLTLTVRIGANEFTCVEAATKLDDDAAYPIRLIEGGRFLNRFDLLGLVFKDAAGATLPATGRLEVLAWPERLGLTLELTATGPLEAGTLEISLKAGDSPVERAATPFSAQQTGGACVTRLVWGAPEDPIAPTHIHARDPRADNTELPVVYSEALSAYEVKLPVRQWTMAEDLDRLDRYPLRLINDSDATVSLPLVFTMEGAFQGVTGLSPMLRDATGQPTGIPVQLSKNWHRRKERRLLYEGAWFRGATQITVPAKGVWEGEFTMAYARWGGVPAASHAQLSLVGWGGNQRWDQAAIGSFGESICYDPDVGLNRAMIDDVRPLLVRGMNDGRWEWTHNVGGGDFLVYRDAAGKQQPLTGVRTAYLSQGPNLTRVVYGGHAADGKIRARIEVSTPRCDDVNRAYHHLRYDVDAPVSFQRLAFYQMGADHYNDHQFTRYARGNADGLLEEWPAARGGKKYLRDAVAAEGAAPWVALLGGLRSPSLSKGAWADRAFVVRAWRARLGGQDVPAPVFGYYGTENGVPSANVELVPPPGCISLLPGDFVDAEIEWIVLPQTAEDYYGPNEALRAELAQHGGGWEPVHRLAKLNALDIEASKGTVLRKLPLCLKADADGALDVSVRGGAGYVPVQISGLKAPTGQYLEVDGAPLQQSVHGNDFWQADTAPDGTFTLTYNVSFDNAGAPRRLRLMSTGKL